MNALLTGQISTVNCSSWTTLYTSNNEIAGFPIACHVVEIFLHVAHMLHPGSNSVPLAILDSFYSHKLTALRTAPIFQKEADGTLTASLER